MALLEDLTKGNALAGVAVVALATALPLAVPALRPSWRSVLKAGLTLFFESEAEAEGEIIDALVGATMKQLSAALSGPGSEGERRDAAHATVSDFKRRARARVRRYGWDEQDCAARYRRHVSKLHHAVCCEQRRRSGPNAQVLERISDSILEDW